MQVLRADGHVACAQAALDRAHIRVRVDARAHADERELREGTRAVVRKDGERRGEGERLARRGRVEDEGAEVRREPDELREDQVCVTQCSREEVWCEEGWLGGAIRVVRMPHLSGCASRAVRPRGEERDAEDLRRVAPSAAYRLHKQLERVQQRMHTPRGARGSLEREVHGVVGHGRAPVEWPAGRGDGKDVFAAEAAEV